MKLLSMSLLKRILFVSVALVSLQLSYAQDIDPITYSMLSLANEKFSGTVSERYNDSPRKKTLLSFSASAFKVFGINLYVDLVDYQSYLDSLDGKTELEAASVEGYNGWITIWVDAFANAGAGLLPASVGLVEVDLPSYVDDPRRKKEFSALSAEAGFIGVSGIQSNGTGAEVLNVNLNPKTNISASLIGGAFNIARFEIRAEDYTLLMNSLMNMQVNPTMLAFEMINRIIEKEADDWRVRLKAGSFQVRAFTSLDDNAPRNVSAEFMDFRGGLDLDSDGVPDNYFRSLPVITIGDNFEIPGWYQAYDYLNISIVNNGNQEKDFIIKVIENPDDWGFGVYDEKNGILINFQGPLDHKYNIYDVAPDPHQIVTTHWRIQPNYSTDKDHTSFKFVLQAWDGLWIKNLDTLSVDVNRTKVDWNDNILESVFDIQGTTFNPEDQNLQINWLDYSEDENASISFAIDPDVNEEPWLNQNHIWLTFGLNAQLHNSATLDLSEIPFGEYTVWGLMYDSQSQLYSKAGSIISITRDEPPGTPYIQSPDDVEIDDLTPQLTWSSFSPGQVENQNQEGYQIQVYDLEGTMVYNTGFISDDSENSHAVKEGQYSGYDAVTDQLRISEAFQYGESYHWRVRYLDAGYDWSQWSTYGSFSFPPYAEVNELTLISQMKSFYRDEQVISISWASPLSNNQAYAVELLQNGTVVETIESGTTVKSTQFAIPVNYHNTQGQSGYQIRIREIGTTIEITSAVFSIFEALKDYDLSLNNLTADRTYVRPGNTIGVNYEILNSGNVTVSGDDYYVSYVWRTENGTIVKEGNAWANNLPDLARGVRTTGSANISAPDYEDQFLTLELTVEYSQDYKSGNNTAFLNLYIGNDEPYVTFERKSGGSFELLFDTPQTVDGGYVMEVDVANMEMVRLKVTSPGGSVEGFDFYDRDMVYIIHGGQFAFTFKYAYDMDGIGYAGFEYYLPLADPDEFKVSTPSFKAEAGRCTQLPFTCTESSMNHRVVFFEDGTENPERFEAWDFDETMNSGTEGTIDIDIPLDQTRRNYEYWVKFLADVSDRVYIQKLRTEVVDPVPDFFPQLSTNTVTLAPGRAADIQITMSPEFDFAESIIASLYNTPSGVSYTLSQTEFGVNDEVTLTIALSESYSGNYEVVTGSRLGLYSDNRRKDLPIYLNIVDDSKNFISINSIDYIDADAKQDSLQLNFTASFSLAETSNTSDWEYYDGSNWISVPAENIQSPSNYTPGDYSILWEIDSDLQIPDAKFRMKNKNGSDFLGQTERIIPYGADDNNGLAFDGSVLYVVETGEYYYSTTSDDEKYFTIRKYDVDNAFEYKGRDRIELPFTGGQNSISESSLHLYIEGNYYFIYYTGDNRLWVSQKDYNAGGTYGEVNFITNGKTVDPVDKIEEFILINNNLYTIHEDHDRDLFYLMEISTSGNLYSTSYTFPYGANRDVDYAFFDGVYVWFFDGNSIDVYTLDGQLQNSYTYTQPSGTDHIAYYDKKMYHTESNDYITVHSLVDPYSFFTESQTFDINSTYPPQFIGEGRLTLTEDQGFDTISLDTVILDMDTDIGNLTFEFNEISDGLDLVYDTVQAKFAIKPLTDVDSDQHFEICVSDGYNDLSQDYEIDLIPVDDNGIELINGKIITVFEDDSVKIPFDSIYTDVDTEPSGLEFLIAATVDAKGTGSDIYTEVNIEDFYLLLRPEADIFGDYTIGVRIRNPLSDSTVVAGFTLEVLPRNDPPSSFELLSPLSERILPGKQIFTWEPAIDPEGDAVEYQLIVSFNGVDSIKNVNSTETSLILNAEHAGHAGFWQVVATDGTDQTYPTNDYGYFYIVADSSKLYPFENILQETLEYSLMENTPVGTPFANLLNHFPGDLEKLQFELNGTDLFGIDQQGYITLLDTVDFEAENMYTCDFNIMYDGQEGISYNGELTINIENVNETPIITNDAFEVPENWPMASTIGYITAQDPESDGIGYFLIESDIPGAVHLEGTGELVIIDTDVFNFEENTSFVITVGASDGEFTDTAEVQITILDVNEAPNLASSYFQIPENSLNNSLVGTLDFSDPENDNLIFTILSGNETGAFTVNTAGELRVADSAYLDFETSPEFYLVIKAADEEFFDTEIIQVSLTDVTETTGILESLADKLLVYPNPVLDELFISTKNADLHFDRIRLMDGEGRSLLVRENVVVDDLYRIDVSAFRSGMYYLSVQNKNQSKVYKIIINHQ